MKHRRYKATFAAVIAFAGVTFWLLPKGPPAADISHHSIVVGDDQRSFRLVVSQNLATPTPVVFAFHGIGDSPNSMAAYSKLDRLAADNGLVLVYPEARNAIWAAIDVDPETLDANTDVQFFDALLEHIASRHNIDFDRVYLLGMSNGASFVQILANARTSDIAAVVAHSGPRPRALNDAKSPFPILLIVGSKDLAAGSMQSDFDYYQRAGHDSNLIVVDGLGHAWSTSHNAGLWEFLADRKCFP